MSPDLAASPQWWAVVLLGLVEGVTEFLPVSSTGHLLLAERVLPRQSDAFNIIIQVGAVLAVLAAFRARLTAMLRSWRAPATRRYGLQLACAFVLTGVGGLALKKAGLKLPETTAPIAWATLIGGVLFVAVERGLARKPAGGGEGGIGWPAAVAMGLGQLVAAVFPGASRSGTTILFALCLSTSRPAAIEFSFLLGLPTILAAGGLELSSIVRHGEFSEPLLPLLVASVVSLLTATAVVRWLLTFVRSHSFEVFGYYRIALGALLLWLG